MSEKLNLQVKLTSGRMVTFPSFNHITAGELSEEVAAEEKVPAELITLKFAEKVMKRCKSMVYYGMREEMVLKVKLLTKTTLKVHLQLPNNEDLTLEIFNTSSLSVIKDKLLKAKPDLVGKDVSFHIGQMTLNFNNYAYEDCLVDGEKILVKVKIPGMAEEEVEEIAEEDRQEVLNSFLSGMTSDRRVDIVFSFDTTGSMYSLLESIQQVLRQSVTRLIKDIPNIQIGIIAHGDFCDQNSYYVLRKHDLTSNVEDLENFVTSTSRSGGQGNVACYEWVLHQANRLTWREEAAKALVIIGDVVPHAPSYSGINWRTELEALCQKEVKVYGVQARDYRPAKSFYGFMARKSGGAHIKFQHFSLITDMFLAVCYRESGDEQLQAYVDEVENEGRMTDEMKDVMKQLAEQKPEEEEEEKEKEKEEETNEGGAVAAAAPAQARAEASREEEYVAEDWWDFALDTTTSQIYEYNEENDIWTYIQTPTVVQATQPSNSSSNSSSKKKKKCIVM